jgi:hypothetical protein
MDDCLTRPVTLAALAALAERWLGAAWPERAAPGNPTAAPGAPTANPRNPTAA